VRSIEATAGHGPYESAYRDRDREFSNVKPGIQLRQIDTAPLPKLRIALVLEFPDPRAACQDMERHLVQIHGLHA
jgi:hypothetical protein